MCLLPGKTYTATIETNNGTVRVTLRNDIAPNTVNSFVNLARFHYFDGTTCHRAIRNFVVQCGDPTASGMGGPGYEFADELDKIEAYRIGSVAMANAGPNTNGSQFFIITGDDGASLPPNYTLFGQVIDDDLGVVATLDGLANPADGPPLQPIDIVKVTIDEK
ncbi:MAG: peptidylprolyl isomerase [Acidobacteria bacterium]|nr:peptidylprolyl isomerase [Acidobacteriota bacterium]